MSDDNQFDRLLLRSFKNVKKKGIERDMDMDDDEDEVEIY